MLENDGDIVRGVGFVTIYSAHLEGRIDELLFQLSVIKAFTDKDQRLPISQKIEKARKILKSVSDPLAIEICESLVICKDLFESRNELIHGRILSPDYHEKNLKSSRPNYPDRPVTAEELYALANELITLGSQLYRPMIFELPRLLNQTL